MVFLAQAAILAGLYVAGSSMPAALVLVMLVGLVMYVASIPSVSHFMDVARRRYPKALTLASSLEPLSFNVGIAFGTFVGGVVVSLVRGSARWAWWAQCSPWRQQRWWVSRWRSRSARSRAGRDGGAGELLSVADCVKTSAPATY